MKGESLLGEKKEFASVKMFEKNRCVEGLIGFTFETVSKKGLWEKNSPDGVSCQQSSQSHRDWKLKIESVACTTMGKIDSECNRSFFI